MNAVSSSASRLFSSEFGNLSALVCKRLELEWRYHKRADPERADQELLLYLLEFGKLLNVVYKYNLLSALWDECKWYARLFGARGSRHDSFALVLDSWIIAIQGLLKPPECNELARPIQSLRDGLDSLIEQASYERKALIKPVNPELLKKLICGDVRGAHGVISAIATEFASPERLIVEVLLPMMAEVGQRWEANELEVFQEHLATEAIRSLLAGLSFMIPESRLETDAVAMVSCAPGDEHELIPLALATYLAFQGWTVKNLGGSLPADQIALAVAALKPKALFLTFTMLSRLEAVSDLIEKINGESKHCRIILGGHGAVVAKEALESQGALVALDFEDGFRLACGDSIDA